MVLMIKSLAMGNEFDLQFLSFHRRRGGWGLSEGKASNTDLTEKEPASRLRKKQYKGPGMLTMFKT